MEILRMGKILYWRLYRNNIKSEQIFPLFTERRSAGQNMNSLQYFQVK